MGISARHDEVDSMRLQAGQDAREPFGVEVLESVRKVPSISTAMMEGLVCMLRLSDSATPFSATPFRRGASAAVSLYRVSRF